MSKVKILLFIESVNMAKPRVNASRQKPVKPTGIKPLGKLIKEEAGRIVREVESQITGADFAGDNKMEDREEAEAETKKQKQLAAVRRRLKEIREEIAAASQEISQEREKKRKVREGKEKDEEKRPFSMVPDLLPESASKPKSHMPPQVGVERRKKR